MIKLSNGHRLEYVAASGALAYDGCGWPWEKPLQWIGLLDPNLFTIVTRTITRKARKGNFRWLWPLGTIRFLDKGIVNSMGLTNPGLEWWRINVGAKIKSKGLSLIPSIWGDPGDLSAMAMILQDYDIVGLELNASCPNVGDDLAHNTNKIINNCERIKRVCKLPLILKLSVANDCLKIAPAVEGCVEAISINSVPWHVAFPEKESPLAYFGGGGVSGKVAQEYTWRLVEDLVNASDIPVIGPSIWDYEDIQQVRSLGAQAISFGSIFLRYPWRPTRIVHKDQKQQ
ncbi:hypothetical protein ACFL1U_01615 [Patescibacteria group bacterium]